MKVELITDIHEARGPCRILYIADEISVKDIRCLINIGMREIFIFGRNAHHLEMQVDHEIVSINIENASALDITTVSFDVSEEKVEDALLLFSSNVGEIKNNYIFFRV